MINHTLYQLSLKCVPGESPLICKGGNLNIVKANYLKTNVPFIHITNNINLIIYQSTFHNLNDKVLVWSRSSLTKFSCSCSVFSDISTDKSGSIFDLHKCDVQISHCFIFRVSSSVLAACFYIEESEIKVNSCAFVDCKASHGDGKFGNAFYTTKSVNTFYNLITYHCSPNPNDSGDSAIATREALTTDYHHSNATNNCGKDGSSLISYWGSTAETNYISFINVYDSSEHNCIELIDTKISNIVYTNFIDAHNVFTIIHNDNDNSIAIFEKCAFISSTTSVFATISGITLHDCISNVATQMSNLPHIVALNDWRISINVSIMLMCPNSISKMNISSFFSAKINSLIYILLINKYA